MSLRVLATFEGYTIDKRLREFRKVPEDLMESEFIPFDSDEGDALLCRMIEVGRVDEVADLLFR